MRNLAVLLTVIVMSNQQIFAQDKAKLVRFSNITEAAVGFQIGKTSQIVQMGSNETELDIAGYKLPSPRVSSSFGAFVGQLFFIGPGFSYVYQSSDENNPTQHHVSAFGHMRFHLLKGLLRPYLEIKGGYTRIIPEGNAGVYSQSAYTWDGAFAEPALGIGIKLGGHAQLNVSLGYQFLNAWNRSEGLTSAEAFGPELEDVYHRLLLSLGFSFY
jgi:hypothetical protein